MLARPEVRVHHRLWHFVRSKERWNALNDEQRQQLTDAEWMPPRFETEPGAGLDFLGMHRQMIQMTNQMLSQVSDTYWPSASAWDTIPWDDDNDDWPVPDWPNAHPDAMWARQSDTLAQMQELVKNRFMNSEWLRTLSLDQLGTSLEFSIHAWMHLRWSGPPPPDTDTEAPSNDWLFIPWSSHVNKHFWKLHPWIDARIDDWEVAVEQEADLSDAWSGAPGVLPNVHHSAATELLAAIPSKNEMQLPMLPKDTIIEGVMAGRKVPWGEKP